MSLTYYLTIDGIDGGSTAPGHEGAFEISSYDFHITLPPGGVIGGSGGGSGVAEFSPLTVLLDLGLGSTALLRDLALGGHIDSVRLEGVTSGNDTVYDLRLANVLVGGYSDTNAGHDQLVFEYAQIGLSTRSQNADGSLNDPQSFAFNVATRTDAAMPPVPVPHEPSTPGDDIVNGTFGADFIEGGGGNDQISGGPGNDIIFGDFSEALPRTVPQPVKYYLTIDGIDGGS